MHPRTYRLALGVLLLAAAARADFDAAAARSAAERATACLRGTIACHGGYLWTYSLDLAERAGEEKATASQVWVQPPGTPSLGLAYLALYDATGDQRYLDAATDAGECLAWGQLASGGWDYLIDFDETASQRWVYRRDVEAGKPVGKLRNTSTVDDDNTQSALRLLIELDRRWQGKRESIHTALTYGLDALVKAQYANGAWPQRYSGPAPERPVLKARYPESWSRTFPEENYAGYYTLNDDTLADCVSTMLLAWEWLGDERWLASAKRGGEFLILAQMPDPQPAWAQQYNPNMEPAWARKFEPPAITGAESCGALRTLVELWLRTGDERFLKPILPALDWYEKSQIAPNVWARFYELQTSKPLYFVKDTYELTYDGSNVPTHYSFSGNYARSTIELCRRTLAAGREATLAQRSPARTKEQWARRAQQLLPAAQKVAETLDAEGRWVTGGRIEMQTAERNLRAIAAYLEAAGKAGG
ncbi:MAG: hypothetical protein HYU66_09580 [Armatimonadetes bacterium]|nr:hypothetical protein [Armatimonadota bacterium]